MPLRIPVWSLLAAVWLLGAAPCSNAFVERWMTNFDGFLPQSRKKASRTVDERVSRCAGQKYIYHKRGTRRCIRSKTKKLVKQGKMTEEDQLAISHGLTHIMFHTSNQFQTEVGHFCGGKSKKEFDGCLVRTLADMTPWWAWLFDSETYILIDYILDSSLYDCREYPSDDQEEATCVERRLHKLVRREVILPSDYRHYLDTVFNVTCPKESLPAGEFCSGYPDEFTCRYGHIYVPQAKGRDRKCTGKTTCNPTTTCTCGNSDTWSCASVRFGSCNGEDVPENTLETCDA